LKFGYPFEWPAGGVGPGVVVGFSLKPPTYEFRTLCRRSYTVSVLGQANDLCCFTLSSELRALCKGGTPSHIFIYTQHPPGHFRTPHGTRLCTYTCGGPGLNPAYICRHVSGHVSTPGCVSRLGPERSTSSLTVLVLSQYLYYTVHRLDRIRLRAWSTRNQIWITMRTDMLW